MNDKDLDRQGIEEMTAGLRDGTLFQGLAGALTASGFDLQRLILTYFLESEDGAELGAFITDNGTVYRFERVAYPDGPNLDTFRCSPFESRAAAIAEFAEVKTGLEMLDQGELVAVRLAQSSH